MIKELEILLNQEESIEDNQEMKDNFLNLYYFLVYNVDFLNEIKQFLIVDKIKKII